MRDGRNRIRIGSLKNYWFKIGAIVDDVARFRTMISRFQRRKWFGCGGLKT